MERQALQRRAEVAMWGCLACAQPWLVAGSKWGAAWGFAAAAAWLVARLASGSQTVRVNQAYTGYTPRPQAGPVKPPPRMP